MDVLTYETPNEGATHHRLFVFLRGMGGSHRSFEKEGLVEGVQARGLPFDMVAPNAHFGYYSGRTLIARLKADVIDPARARGYQEIWLIGFSMGGLGSILYLMEHPEDIAGVCLIAPFLGYASITEEITEAGGVRRWEPATFDAEKDWQRMVWHWLKSTVADDPDAAIYLGYGTKDPYSRGQALLAGILPTESVFTIPGGHDYRTFITLWNMFLDSGQHLETCEQSDARPALNRQQ